MRWKHGNLTIKSVDSIGHNHLWGDLNISGVDYKLVNGRGSWKGETAWLWNEKGEAWSLTGEISNKSFSAPRTIEGSRHRDHDIKVSW